MKRIKHIISLFIITIICVQSIMAQQGFYVPEQGKVFFNGDSSTIFSNVINSGRLGIGKRAVVNFKGRNWNNNINALITDESEDGNGVNGTGGVVRFMDTSKQYITGGYNAVIRYGASFPNLIIDNKAGVYLDNSSSKIRNELVFKTGHLFLGDNILSIGNNSPGKITGYDAGKFIVTNNKVNSGILIRESIRAADGLVVFPVGATIDQYTPASIKSKSSQPDNYYVTVFDKTLANGAIGEVMSDNSVNTTWEIGKTNQSQGIDAEVFLQHLKSREGALFAANRKYAYVSKYDNGSWDIGSPKSEPVNSTNSRTFTYANYRHAYFTKFAATKDTAGDYKNHLWFSGYRVDLKTVNVFWTTKPEINNKYFILQRRFSNENAFFNIDTILTKSQNGFSIDYLRYSVMDPNSYRGITYYRLIMVSNNLEQTLSNIIAIGPKAGGNELLLWPNPSTGKFKVSVNDYASIKTIMVWNVIGQKLIEEPVNERGIIEMELRTPGTYVVGFISFTGQIMETKKLLIVPK
jgi:hypothetical protein